MITERAQIVVAENVTVLVQDRHGRVLWRWRGKNLVTNVGLATLPLWMAGTTQAILYGAVGTSNTAADPGQTGLINEVYRANVAQRTPTGETHTTRFFVPTTAANGQTLREAGLFTGDNRLFSRFVHDDIAKTAQITVTYLWTHSYSRV